MFHLCLHFFDFDRTNMLRNSRSCSCVRSLDMRKMYACCSPLSSRYLIISCRDCYLSGHSRFLWMPFIIYISAQVTKWVSSVNINLPLQSRPHLCLVTRWCKSWTERLKNNALMRSAGSVGEPSSLYSRINHGGSEWQNDGLTTYNSRYAFFRRHDISRALWTIVTTRGALETIVMVNFHISIPWSSWSEQISWAVCDVLANKKSKCITHIPDQWQRLFPRWSVALILCGVQNVAPELLLWCQQCLNMLHTWLDTYI